MTEEKEYKAYDTEQACFAKLATKAKSESTLRNSNWLPSTGSGPEHVKGNSS